MRDCFVVHGAGGALGKVVYSQLAEHHGDVIPLYRTYEQAQAFGHSNPLNVVDVTNCDYVRIFYGNLDRQITGIVYAVGHYPSGAYMGEINRYIKTDPVKAFRSEFEMHVIGVRNLFWSILNTQHIANPMHIVIIGSAISELSNKGLLPPFVHAPAYIAATAAKRALVREARKEMPGYIKLSYIAFGGFDSGFFNGAPPDLVPPKLISMSDAAQKVVEALMSAEGVDWVISDIG